MPHINRFRDRTTSFKLIAVVGFALILLATLLISSLYQPRLARADTTYVVNSLLDTADATLNGVCETATGNGICTLRAAIQEANYNNTGRDTILFDTTLFSVPRIIELSSPLPALTDDSGTIIDASSTNHNVTISAMVAGNTDHGINLWSQNNTIKGLVLRRFSGDSFGAIYTDRSNNTILDNYIGLNADGASIDYPNGNGIYIKANSTPGVNVHSIVISGNVIAGNSISGITLLNDTSTNTLTDITITNNIIGPDKSGNTLITSYRQQYGIHFNGKVGSTTVGGATSAERNVISGNYDAGIYFESDSVGGAKIIGNYIGPAKNGTSMLVDPGSNTLTCAVLSGQPQNRGIYFYSNNSNIIVGGSFATQGNLISGNCEAGIYFQGLTNLSGGGIQIMGNIIGPNSTGTARINNSGDTFYCNPVSPSPSSQANGIFFNGPISGVTIGDDNSSDGVDSKNVITSNCYKGIYFYNTSASASSPIKVSGNYIGPDATGSNAIINYDYPAYKYQLNGVAFQDNTSNVILGGNPPNIISGNYETGIITNNLPDTTSGNHISGNYIGPNASGNQFNVLYPQPIGLLVNGSNIGSQNLTIGEGQTAATRNIISGNSTYGIRLQNSSINNLLFNNWIGYKPDGITLLRNGSQGIIITPGSQLKTNLNIPANSNSGNRINRK
jgi:CSLREA domain-containing protein